MDMLSIYFAFFSSINLLIYLLLYQRIFDVHYILQFSSSSWADFNFDLRLRRKPQSTPPDSKRVHKQIERNQKIWSCDRNFRRQHATMIHFKRPYRHWRSTITIPCRAFLPGVNNGERFQGAISHPCASLSGAHNVERRNIFRTLLGIFLYVKPETLVYRMSDFLINFFK